jgi:threonine/homoserine/homoserine lactone efflux protein
VRRAHHGIDAMLGIHDLPLFIVSGLLLNLTPGADTLFVVSRATAQGQRAGMVAALGIGAGCTVHITAAAVGVSALLVASANAFNVVKWLGAAYLVYLGIGMLRAQGAPAASSTAPEVTPGPMLRPIFWPIFWQGFMTNALNPKVAMFFLAFLPQFIAPDAAHPGLAMVLLGCVFNVNATLYLLIVAWLTTRAAARWQGAHAAARWLQRGLGALFILFGARLALSTR